MCSLIFSFVKSRIINLACFTFCCALVVFAAMINHLQKLEPCPLCFIQVLFFLLIGLVFLMAFFVYRKKIMFFVFQIINILLVLLGSSVAARQIWLLYFATSDKVCGLSLDYMLINLPFLETLKLAFRGSGNCQNLQTVILGIHTSFWSLIIFIVLGIIAFCQIKKCPTCKKSKKK